MKSAQEEKKKQKKKKRGDKNEVYFPTLEMLCYNLEAANSHPSKALDHLKDLAQDVDKICDHIEMTNEYFTRSQSGNEDEVKELIETFM